MTQPPPPRPGTYFEKTVRECVSIAVEDVQPGDLVQRSTSAHGSTAYFAPVFAADRMTRTQPTPDGDLEELHGVQLTFGALPGLQSAYTNWVPLGTWVIIQGLELDNTPVTPEQRAAEHARMDALMLEEHKKTLTAGAGALATDPAAALSAMLATTSDAQLQQAIATLETVFAITPVDLTPDTFQVSICTGILVRLRALYGQAFARAVAEQCVTLANLPDDAMVAAQVAVAAYTSSTTDEEEN